MPHNTQAMATPDTNKTTVVVDIEVDVEVTEVVVEEATKEEDAEVMVETIITSNRITINNRDQALHNIKLLKEPHKVVQAKEPTLNNK